MKSKAVTRFQRGSIICPVCRFNAHIRGGEWETSLVRSLWCHCSNTDCGMTWKMQLAFVHVVSPSGIPGGGDDLPPPPAGFKRVLHPPVEMDPNQYDMFGPPGDEEDPGPVDLAA